MYYSWEIENSPELQRELVEASIRAFNEQERYLMENDLNERCICARFAMYLEYQLHQMGIRDYVVDVEYDRGMAGCEQSRKQLANRKIIVDLIVHKRKLDAQYGFRNLLCMEMEKSTNPMGCADDEDRLKKMTSLDYGFCYKAGVMLLVNMERAELQVKEVFHNGEKVEEWLRSARRPRNFVMDSRCIM